MTHYSVLKSRMQAGSSEGQRYKSSLDGLLTVVEEEGISGLYKGMGTKLMQSVLNAAILFVSQRRIYEITKQVSQDEEIFFFVFCVRWDCPRRKRGSMDAD